MSPKAQPSKQKRAAQNRSERAARAARAANAQSAPASGPSASGGGGGSLFSRLIGGGASTSRVSPSGRAVPVQAPGHRAALSAVFAATAALLLCTFALRYPVDANGDLYTRDTLAADWTMSALRVVAEDPQADAADVADAVDQWAPGRDKEVVAKALWPYSLSLVLPLIGAALGFQAVRKRSSGRTVNRTLFVTLFGAVLTNALVLLFLPAVLALGVATFQVRRAEAQAAAQSSPTGGSGVIDVDEVAPDDDGE